MESPATQSPAGRARPTSAADAAPTGIIPRQGTDSPHRSGVTVARRQVRDRGFAVELSPDRLALRHAAYKKSTTRVVVFAVIGTLFGAGWLYVALRVFKWEVHPAQVLALKPTALALILILVWPLVSGWLQLARVAINRHDLTRALRRMQTGPALLMRRDGLLLTHAEQVEFLPWSQVRAIRGVTARAVPGPELRVERADGSYWAVPFSLLALMPGTIDSGVWAYSGRRMHLDMSRCEQVW